MSISNEDVRHIAGLARIELTDQETEKLEGELAAILGFVEKLNEIDTAGVLPLTGGTTLESVMRRDGAEETLLEGKSAALLGAVPELKEGWVKVKAVFE
jgi:aspartyl-tRNA(Asn)/glutamyl-tRNA(Gln) amidotransferase subunit C